MLLQDQEQAEVPAVAGHSLLLQDQVEDESAALYEESEHLFL